MSKTAFKARSRVMWDMGSYFHSIDLTSWLTSFSIGNCEITVSLNFKCLVSDNIFFIWHPFSLWLSRLHLIIEVCKFWSWITSVRTPFLISLKQLNLFYALNIANTKTNSWNYVDFASFTWERIIFIHYDWFLTFK